MKKLIERNINSSERELMMKMLRRRRIDPALTRVFDTALTKKVCLVGYYIDKDNNFTTAIVRHNNQLHIGVSKRMIGKDEHNPQIGQAIAFSRAVCNSPLEFSFMESYV